MKANYKIFYSIVSLFHENEDNFITILPYYYLCLKSSRYFKSEPGHCIKYFV